MKNNNNITCYADLEREEKKVKNRIRKQEEEILIRVKQLPEEILVSVITKVIRNIIDGNIVKSGMSIISSIASHFFNKESGPDENTEEKKGNFKGTIADVLKNIFNKNASPE